ncbi:hypothetical protein CPAR01_07658, partial [Colletotrichum paranaense]
HRTQPKSHLPCPRKRPFGLGTPPQTIHTEARGLLCSTVSYCLPTSPPLFTERTAKQRLPWHSRCWADMYDTVFSMFDYLSAIMNTSSHPIVAFSYQLYILPANVPCSRPLRLQLHRAPPPDRLVRELSKTSGSMTMRSRCHPTPAYWLPRGWLAFPTFFCNTCNLRDVASPLVRGTRYLGICTDEAPMYLLSRSWHDCYPYAPNDWAAPYLRLTRRIGATRYLAG